MWKKIKVLRKARHKVQWPAPWKEARRLNRGLTGTGGGGLRPIAPFQPQTCVSNMMSPRNVWMWYPINPVRTWKINSPSELQHESTNFTRFWLMPQNSGNVAMLPQLLWPLGPVSHYPSCKRAFPCTQAPRIRAPANSCIHSKDTGRVPS